MKKTISLCFILLISISFFLPVAVGAQTTASEPPPKPYDRIIVKSGSWYIEQVGYNTGSKLIFAYTGSYAADEQASYEFRIDEPVLLKGICIPFSNEIPGELTLKLIDDKGALCGEYKARAFEAESNNRLTDFIAQEKPIKPTNYIYTSDQGNVLPEGIYTIVFDHALDATGAFLLKGVNQAAYLKYLKDMEEYENSHSFTGTYAINLDAYKTSTLGGTISNPVSEFQLTDFELVILEKGEEIEVIGKYEGMPFSQPCTITESLNNGVQAQFNFSINLPNLPSKVDISVNALITLTYRPGLSHSIDIKGTANYSRAASASKGADFNTYSIVGNGFMKNEELPAFVATALGKKSGVGNIPGPGSPQQAAVGILFPPLAGLLVNVLQEIMKPKVRDKSWYMKKYPGKSENEIAMIMLADAMGSTDNPDEGDAISIGDNEKDAENTYGASEPINDTDTTYEYDYEKDGEFNQTDAPDTSGTYPVSDDVTYSGSGPSGENVVIYSDGTVEVSTPDGNVIVCTTDGKTVMKTPDGNALDIKDVNVNDHKVDNNDNVSKELKKSSRPEPEPEDYAADYLRLADNIANIYGLSGIKEKAENTAKIVKEGFEASADLLRDAFAKGDADDAIKNFTSMFRMSQTAERVKSVANGISTGFEFAGIGLDVLNNMQDLNREDGSLIEGDGLLKAFAKSVVANKIASALADKNPAIVLMEVANSLALGGTEAGDIISPMTNIKGAINATFDLVLDSDKAFDRIKAGGYGPNIKNLAEGASLSKEAFDDPSKFIKELGEVGNDKEFFKGMQETAGSMFRDKNGNIGYIGAAAEATAQMGVAMTETAASMAKMAGEMSGHLYENASMKIKSFFSW